MLSKIVIFAGTIKMTKLKLWNIIMKIGNCLGCHQLPDRSFFIMGYQFPVCARCAGIWVGYITAILLKETYQMSTYLSLLFVFVMFVDWYIQYRNIRMSTNWRRFITGFLCGYGILNLTFKVIGELFYFN